MEDGLNVRHHWRLDPDVAFCNNGSFGATPIEVLEVQRAEQDRMELQPVAYLLSVGPRLREAASAVGEILGAKGRDIVFVDNATTGVNTVLASLPVRPGDVWLTTSHVYGAVRNAMRHFAGKGGGTVREADVAFPIAGPEVVVEALRAALTSDVRLVVVDHVTSATGLVFPVQEIVAMCRAAGVPILVDGAHVPGQVDVDLTALDADWYVANLHKWLFTPKGCAILWVRRDWQAAIRPLVISHGYGLGFHEEFDWTGTRDPSPALCVPAAIEFAERRLGGFSAIRAVQSAKRREAEAIIVAAWGTPPVAPPSMLAALQTLELPFHAVPTEGPAIHDALVARHRVEVPIFPFAGRCWCRISAQVYTTVQDWRRLVAAMDGRGVR